VAPAAEGNFAARMIQRMGPRTSFIDAADGRSIGPGELPRLIAAYGTSLIAAGLKAGERVLIGCALSPSSALTYLGAIYAGLVAVPVDERTLAASPSVLADAVRANAVWSEKSLAREKTLNPSVLRLKGDLARGIGQVLEPAPSTPSDLAALMATSGSTGVPRFVKVSHENLIANTEAIGRSQSLAEDERALLILPVSYCFGASVMQSHLYRGGSVVFDRRFMFPDRVLEAVTQYECTTFAGVPTVYNVLLRRSNIRRNPMPTLRRFLQAGGGLARERVQEMRELFPKVEFYVMYGQTEATARISCMDPDRWHEKPGSVGRPLDNIAVSIVDDQGNPVHTGEVGQLLVKGPSICPGYFNDDDETRRVFSGGWLHTGDLARQDEDGFLWIEGRAGSFLKIRGTRISLAEVEARVTAIPGVYECGACAVDDPEAGEALVLLIVPDKGAKLAKDRIRRDLPAHWTLASVQFVSELPKTSAGKIARSALSTLSKELHGAA
jgi:acyl-CoA synthetase (AMP-forming)/AMP-acid ligase II